MQRLRRVASKVVEAITPGKYIQSAGSSLFSSTTAMLYLLHKDLNENEDSALKDPYVLALAGLAILTNVIVTRRTRIPAMRRKIAKARRNILRIPLEEKIAEEQPAVQANLLVRGIAKTTSISSKFFTRSSAIWSTWNTLFFTLKLTEFLYETLLIHPMKLMNTDDENEIYKAFTWIIGATIAASNFISYMSLNIEQADKSSDALAVQIETGNFKLDRYSAATASLVLLNAYPTFMFSNVTTEKSLRHLPALEHASSDSLAIPVNLSTWSAVITGILSSNRQIYDFLTKKNSFPIKMLDPVNISNILESTTYGMANMVSMLIKMKQKDSTLDIYSPQAFLPAALFGALAGFIGFIFSRQSYMDTLKAEEYERNFNVRRQVGFNADLIRTPIDSLDIDIDVGPAPVSIELRSLAPPSIADEVKVEVDELKTPATRSHLAPARTSRVAVQSKQYYIGNYTPTTFKSATLAPLTEPLLENKSESSLSLS